MVTSIAAAVKYTRNVTRRGVPRSAASPCSRRALVWCEIRGPLELEALKLTA